VDQERKERIAKNEVSARDLNERFGIRRFVCECGRADCTEVLHLPLEIYQSVRTDARRFIVAPEHDMPEIEDVVRRRDDWLVVRKRDEVAHVVDPAA
jgi:hypothetical protein